MNGERHITVSGNAQYIEYVENNYGNGYSAPCHQKVREMPIELKSEKAQHLLKRLASHGLLDEKFMPLELSTSETAILSFQVSNVLGINDVWRVFGNYWGSNANALRAAYNRGLEQKKTLKFLDEINPLLSDKD